MTRSQKLIGDVWRHAGSFLPDDLDTLAVRSGAIERWRDIKSGEQLLRVILLYASTGSYRTASALAKGSGLADITAEGLFYRVGKAETFLENVLLELTAGMSAPVGFRLFIVDATTVCGPGSVGTDWRVHVGYDPVRGLPGSVYLSDIHVGESLEHHALRPGHLVLADMAYGSARNMHCALEAGADALLRVRKGSVRLIDASGHRVDWTDLEQRVPPTGPVSFEFDMPVPPTDRPSGSGWGTSKARAWHSVRLVAARNREGEVVWLLTNLGPERLKDADACELYRVRWQVELYFRRLKSIGDLDMVTSRDGPTAKALVLAKLILLILANLLCDREQAFSPYGYRIRQQGPQPVEGVRLRSHETRFRAPAKRSARRPRRSAPILQADKAHVP